MATCAAAAVELGKEMKPDESKLRADYDRTYRDIYLRLKKEKEAATQTDRQQAPKGEGCQ